MRATFFLFIFLFSLSYGDELCPPGFKCQGSSRTLCTQGSYSPIGEVQCQRCPSGHQCPLRTDTPILCKPGFFSKEGKSACQQCPRGHACPGLGNTGPQLCPQYSTYSDKEGAQQCIPCPGGHQCLTVFQAPVSCPLGQFALDGICKKCPAGMRCRFQHKQPQLCASGFYSLEGEPTCTPCPRGYSCSSLDEPPKQCPSGTYSKPKSSECLPCPDGHSCLIPSDSPVPCPPRKTFALYGVCEACPQNHECPRPHQEPQPCQDGYEAQEGFGFCKKIVEQQPEQMEEPQLRQLADGCPTGQYKTMPSNTCIQCPVGKYCADGHYFLRDCPPGTYSPAGQEDCTLCTAGKYCTNSAELTCAAGTFSLTGATECIQCPAGFECPNQDGSNIAPCLNGKYSLLGESTCSNCPADNYCNAFAATPCLPGQWSPAGFYSCLWCPAGYACGGGTKTQCSGGEYSLYKQKVCTQCPAGSYCPDIYSRPLLCRPNEFSNAGAQACTKCPNGQYSFQGWSSCQAVPAGFYVDDTKHQLVAEASYGNYANGGATEAVCKKGYFCEAHSVSQQPVDCPPGHYCLRQDSSAFVDKIPCPAGRYSASTSNFESSTHCTRCPNGSYCPVGTINPIQCPEGFYCLRSEGTYHWQGEPAPCPNNQYSTPGATGCTACPNGFECKGGFKHECPAGSHCASGSVTTCPKGKYNPLHKQNADTCVDCPVGTYCDVVGLDAPIACPAGTYNPNTGSQNANACVNCQKGFACPSVLNQYDDKRFPCVPGHYCLAGTGNPMATPCPQHSYTDSSQLDQLSSCTKCPQGFYCPPGSTFLGQEGNPDDIDNTPGNRPILCPKGWYCPEGDPSNASTGARKCPAGSYNPTRGAISLASCLPCPAGFTCAEGTATIPTLCTQHHYCPPGSVTPTACPDGTFAYFQSNATAPNFDSDYPTYLAATSLADCFAVHPGKYGIEMTECKNNTYNPFFYGFKQSASSSERGCYTAPAGYWTNSLFGQLTPIPCPIGKYGKAGEDCLDCEPGYYCDEFALSEATMLSEKQCPAGYYCVGVGGERTECPVGSFCGAGVSAPTDCTAGTWSFSTRRATACATIPAGYYHDVTAKKAQLCPRGYWCLAGQTSGVVNPCPLGSFNRYLGAKTSDYCRPCPIGYKCDNLGSVEPTLCPPGHYCPASTSVGIQCPAGTFSNSRGLRKVEECQQCWAGSYCQTSGLTKPTEQCNARFYCNAGATEASPAGADCPKHSYCERGTALPTKCSPGQYSIDIGQEDSSKCIDCPLGKWCSGQDDPVNCDAGYYCEGASTTPKQKVAEVSYFALAGASSQTQCTGTDYNFDIAQSSCLSCPNGYFCTGGALYDCYTQGTTGVTTDDDYNQYCVGGVVTKCSSNGSYNTHPNAQSAAFCVSCLQGFNCIFGGTKLQTSATLYANAATWDYDSGTYGWDGNSQNTPAGYVSQTAQASNAFSCPAGKVNPSTLQTTLASCVDVGTGLAAPMGGLPYGVLCIDGYECETAGGVHWNVQLCSAGYKCIAGTKTACPAGQYQPLTGKNYCLPCPQGYTCPSTGTSSPTICSTGNFCPQGAQTETSCNPGTYNDLEGMWDISHCIKCDPGKYCISGTTTPQNCDAGYYCTIGASTATETQCPIGSYCPAGSDFPIECDPGKYCATAGLSAPTGNCDPGYYCVLGASIKNPTILATHKGAQCPAGAYCLAGSAFPTPCSTGTFSSATGLTDPSQCTQCTAGKYCDQLGITSISGNCNQRFYCPQGSSSKFQTACPAGSYCLAGQSTHTLCSTLATPGYQPLTHSNSCLVCPAGYLCSTTAKTQCDYSGESAQNMYCVNNAASPCPAGQIIDYPGASDSSHCITCPPGYYCDNQATELKLKICSDGQICNFGSSTIAGTGDCQGGQYCPVGERPVPCPAGNYCAATKLTSPEGQCQAGYYCPEGADSAQKQNCPVGNYCPLGSAEPTPCPPGTFSNTQNNQQLQDCTTCTAGQHCKGRALTAPNNACEQGYFCPAGSVTEYENLCGSGNYCPADQSAQTPCSVNNYQRAQGQVSCLTCPAGYTCESTGLDSPDICPVGYYCPAGVAKVACPAGTYNPRKGASIQNDCLPCKRGYYCATAGLSDPTNTCDPGYVCTSGSTVANPTNNVVGYLCPQGYYCEGGTEKETPCPPGKYGATTGLVSENSCQLCDRGKYCPSYGATSSTLNCDAGFYCDGGAKVPTPSDLLTQGGRPCSIGFKCTAGTTTQVACPAGEFNPYSGRSACLPCPKGKKCPNTGMSAGLNCDSGHFCPSGTSTPQPCNAGTFTSATNLQKQDQCTKCLPGFYCLGGGESTSGQCSAGYVCPLEASSATPSGSYNKASPSNAECPAGHFCEAGTSVPTPCPRGFWQQNTNQSTCNACPEGKYCDKIGISSTSQMSNCADGFHCKSGATVNKPIDGGITGNPCEAGNYCQAGLQIACLAGTYEPRTGSTQCQTCPAGYYCPVGSQEPTDCPTTSFCPANSGTPTTCPDGYYNDKTGLQSDTQCIPCGPGVYCTNGIQQGNCDAGYFCMSGSSVPNPTDTDGNDKNYSNGPCPVGHFCTSGTQTPTQCSGDKVRSTPGAASDSDCATCPGGYFCVAGFSAGYACPKGYYCPPGSTDPIECPLNTYNENAIQDELTDCISCNTPAIAGTTYCNDTSISSLQAYKCPPGHFCTAGVNDAANALQDITICAQGFYSPNRGAKDACLPCPDGFSCIQGQNSPNFCAKKKECPTGAVGTIDPAPCSLGKYCPEGTGAGLTCPAGYYCPFETEIPIKCPVATYCVPGSSAAIPCPVGTIASNNPNNFDLSSGCQDCEQGTYISTTGQLVCLPCEPGYVCTGGTSQQFPTNEVTHKGYKCKVGHYCPEGTYEDIPCPAGTYNPITGRSSLNECRPCDYNTYNYLTGQNGCLPCGPTAYADLGAQTCTCLGLNRVFQEEDGECVCKTGFAAQRSYQVNFSSSLDCIKKAENKCTGNQIKDELGLCTDLNNCPSCPQGGSRIKNIGLCQCSGLTDVDTACDVTCANNQNKLKIQVDGKVQITQSDGTVTTKNVLVDNPNIAGRWKCPLGSCKVVSAIISAAGRIAASYEPLPQLFTPSLLLLLEGQRELSTSTSIDSAIVCIHEFDSFIFSIVLGTNSPVRTDSVYPIYVQNSVLNTDANFDNSQFLDLEQRVLYTTETINYFIYQFDHEGVFVFATNADQYAYTLVRVLTATQTCPSTTQYIQPMTQQNLLAVGVQRQTEIPAHSEWGVYFGMLFFFIVVLLGLFAIIAHLHAQSIARNKSALLEIEIKDHPCDKRLRMCCWKCCRKCKKCKKQQNRVQDDGGAEQLLAGYDKEVDQRELTLDDLRMIKNLADRLTIELQDFEGGGGKDFGQVLKRAQRLNGRLLKISTQNKLKPEEDMIEIRKKRKEKEMRLKRGDLLSEFDQEDRKSTQDSQPSGGSQLNEKLEEDLAKCMGKLEQEAQSRHKDDIERRRADMDAVLLQKNSELSEIEKRELLKAHETDIARINNLLKLESQKQEQAMRRKLQERKHKHALLEKHIETEEAKRGKIEEEAKDQLKFAKEVAQKELEELQNLEELRKKELNDLQKQQFIEREEFKARTKQELQQALKRGARGGTQRLLQEFDQKEEIQLKRMDEDFKQRAQFIRENIEDIADQRADQVKQKLEKQREEVKKNKEAKISGLEKRLEDLKQMQENEALTKELEKREADGEIARRKALSELRARHLREMEELGNREKQELNTIENSMEKVPQYEVDPMLRKQIYEAKQGREGVEERLQRLEKEGLSGEELEREKAKILKEMDEFEKQAMRLEKEANEQRRKLDERLRERKKKMVEKMKKREQFEKERLKQMEKHQKEELLERAQKLEDQLQVEVKRLSLELKGEEYTLAVQKAVELKQREELNMLLAVLLNEKAERLKAILDKLFQDKLDEFSMMKAEFSGKYGELEDEHVEGRLTAEEFEEKVRELKEEENERKKDLELKYFEAQHDAEERVLNDLDAKHDEVLLAMKKKQAEEKTRWMKQVLEREQKALRALELERREAMEQDIADYEEELRRNLRRKKEERERERAQLYSFQRQSEQRMRQRDLTLHKEGLEREEAERKKLEQRREELERKKKEMEEELARRGDLTKLERQRLLQEHDEHMKEFSRVLEAERKRQQDIYMEKLNERKGAKQRYKVERDRRLALFKMHYENMLEEKLREAMQSEIAQAEPHSQPFKKLAMKYSSDIKMFEKVKFPSKLRAKEKDQDERQHRISINLGSPRSRKGSDQISRHSSLFFGKTHQKKSKADPQNLAAVLDRLGAIDGILEKKSKQVKIAKFENRPGF